MKTLKCRPVLVEANTKAIARELFISASNKLQEDIFKNIPSKFNKQQLILVSLDPNEKIEEDEYYVYWNGNKYSIRQNLNCKNLPGGTVDAGIKIIAQQSQLSPKYIQQFIEEYNKREVKDIEIEMEDCGTADSTCGLIEHTTTTGEGFYMGRRPKLTNGFVTIVDKEPKCINDLVDLLYEKIKGEHSKPFVKTMLRNFAIDVIELEQNNTNKSC